MPGDRCGADDGSTDSGENPFLRSGKGIMILCKDARTVQPLRWMHGFGILISLNCPH